jgi:hypothetical protein
LFAVLTVETTKTFGILTKTICSKLSINDPRCVLKKKINAKGGFYYINSKTNLYLKQNF